MTIPLYKGIDKALQTPPEGANYGLWFERFFNQYNGTWQVEDGAKKEFLAPLAAKIGKRSQLSHYSLKQAKLAKAQKGRFGIFKSDWRWVSGLGYAHPSENGLNWHRSLAVPFIPGSTVKGLLRAWLEQQENPDLKRLKQWFGSETKNQEGSGDSDTQQAGELIFFDALPTEPVELKVDVMTPHTGDWLTETKPNEKIAAPADWHDPIPIFFLSCKQTAFNFAIGKMPNAGENLDMDEVWQNLSAALDYMGIGAKTGTGYGFMSLDESISKKMNDKIEDEIAEKRTATQLSKLTPEQQAIALLAIKLEKEAATHKGEGPGRELWSYIKELVDDALKWEQADKTALQVVVKEAAILLGIDITKNKTAKAIVRSLNS